VLFAGVITSFPSGRKLPHFLSEWSHVSDKSDFSPGFLPIFRSLYFCVE